MRNYLNNWKVPNLVLERKTIPLNQWIGMDKTEIKDVRLVPTTDNGLSYDGHVEITYEVPSSLSDYD